ncbi:MAG: outer membrane lipoprotein carrier protein LolA [Rhodospirillaceae bacterium]|nr:outer membrane lipoprotein carrier protein LolA [Rhodospirillaceae bacterium]MBT4464201.1 outer membrane lipoprotein carrier protein LolA [Rhodospirillaceae bacterium]MBT5309398.1 outer membrane lipoprotein carrier protein LolA [Rhodospirillaceae bacterium]MBT6406484.1 outer membrane lipoprotein carrier protein LolA [Rhodospirillaceae bacterium]
MKQMVSVALLVGALFFSGLGEAAAKVEEAHPLSAADRKDLSRIQDYMNRITTLQSTFLQASSNGGYAEGTLYLSRPGKMRIEYDPPAQFLIVADGTWLIYHDKELEQMTHLPLGSTPAAIIVDEKMSLFGDDPKVTRIERGPGVIAVTLVSNDDEGSITLVFGDRPLVLKKWIVIDAQGVRTSVSLLSSQIGVALDDKLFKVKLLQQKTDP